MKKLIVKSFWGEMYDSDDNSDGTYIIQYPDEVENPKEEIKKCFDLIETLQVVDIEEPEELDDTELKALDEVKKLIEGTDISLDLIPYWYESTNGCSFNSVMNFLVRTHKGWSYEYLVADCSFDMDYGNWY